MCIRDRFKSKKLSEVSQEDILANLAALAPIERRALDLNHANANTAARYGGDNKFMRVHKRLLESHLLGDNKIRLHAALSGIKHELDTAVLGSNDLLCNEPFFARSVTPIVMRHFRDHPPEPDAQTRNRIQQLLDVYKRQADGYTLRLIREEIATRYKMQLQQALAQIQVQQGGIEKKALYAHPRFVGAMLDYILDDFTQSRVTFGDDSIDGMVICDSAEQARELHRQFQQRMTSAVVIRESANDAEYAQRRVAEPDRDYARSLTSALILHDENSTQYRSEEILSLIHI